MRPGMICLLFAASVLLGGCVEAEPLRSGPHPPVHLASWQTYWDMEGGRNDYDLLRKKMDAISYFAVAYDENDALYVPEAVHAMAETYKGKKIETYLSFTNDIVGKRRLEKDRELLWRLLGDDAARSTANERGGELSRLQPNSVCAAWSWTTRTLRRMRSCCSVIWSLPIACRQRVCIRG